VEKLHRFCLKNEINEFVEYMDKLSVGQLHIGERLTVFMRV